MGAEDGQHREGEGDVGGHGHGPALQAAPADGDGGGVHHGRHHVTLVSALALRERVRRYEPPEERPAIG
ncbi:hypothetical protein FNH04_05930 [Streptomyces phyllanthi]|uniref:Uncharacterized protein n=1 Tax=Streptomyces phyllanthi TaxID=1803180 RepID=A0A5N8VXM4_9ACTN|nr:hypothetical protein [Streptomyces phyllanthi]